MKKSKILEIGTPRKWEGQHGVIYYTPLKLENGENISLGKKTENAFNVGDVVCYEDYTDDKGKLKQREVKENPFTANKQAFNQQQNIGAMLGMSIKLAFEQMYDKTNYGESMNLAKRIFEDAMQIFETYGKNENKSDENEDSNLPF